MKINSLLVLLGVVILISSCGKQFDKNQQFLLKNDYHSHEIPIDSLQTLGNVLEYFDKIYCDQGDTNWPVLYLNLKKKEFVRKREGGNIVAIGIEPTPCPGFKPEYDFSMILEIIKDGKNIEIEGFRLESDSIPSFVRKQFLNFGYDPLFSQSPEGNGIWLCSERKDKMQDLAPLVTKIVTGYLDMMEEVSKQNFKKSIKDLDEQELKILKNTIPFHLAFKFTDDIRPTITVGKL